MQVYILCVYEQDKPYMLINAYKTKEAAQAALRRWVRMTRGTEDMGIEQVTLIG